MNEQRSKEALACLVEIQRQTSRLIELAAEADDAGDDLIAALIGKELTREGRLNAASPDARDCDLSDDHSRPCPRSRVGSSFVSSARERGEGGPWIEGGEDRRRRR